MRKFKDLKQYFDTNYLKTLYLALVQPHLTYGIIVWGGVLDSHIRVLKNTQRWALKVIYNKNKLYSTDLLSEESNVLDIRQLFIQNIALRQFNKKDIQHAYNTRRKTLTESLPKINTTLAKRHLSPYVYKELPIRVQNSNSIFSFK